MSSFRGYKRSIKLGFDYDEVKSGVQDASKQMSILNSAFRKSSAEAQASGKEIDKLGIRYDYLSNKIRIHAQDVEDYRKKLENATNAKGNSAKAIQNHTASLQIANDKLAQTKAELDIVTQAMAYQQGIIDKNSEEWKDLEYQLELTSAEYSKSSAEAKISGRIVNELSVEHKSLTDALRTQEKQVLAIKEKLQEATTAENKNEEAIKYNRLELAKAEGQLAQTRLEINKVSKELGYQQSIVDKNSDEWKGLEYQLELISAEYAKASVEAKNSGKILNELSAEHKSLSDTIKIQEKQVEMFKEKLKEATTAENKNEEAIKENRLELVKAEGQLAQTRAELNKVTQELDKQKLTLGKTSEEWKDLSEKTTEIGKSMTMKLTVPILGAAAASFKLGADLEDTMGKAEVAFKQNTREVEEWSKSAYKNFGLAGVTALSMATDFAAGFNQLGLTLDKSKDYSMKLTSLVTDMSAFYNTSVEETQNALTAILSGQTEPLKKFQIFMTQANLSEYARQKGIRKTIQEMTEAEKVQLRYNYVLEKTSQAHGQYQREQGSATTELIKFKEGLKEMATSFSEQVLPMFMPFLEFTNSLIEKFSNLSEGTKRLIVTVGGIVAAAGPVIWVLSKVFGSIIDISNGIGKIPKVINGVSKAGSAISNMLSATGSWGFKEWAIAIAGVVSLLITLFALLDSMFNEGRGIDRMVGKITNAFKDMGGAISNTTTRGNTIARRYVDGSHRTGLDYVPYDGYIAELHRGEKVVPADQNKGGNGETFIQNIYVKMDEVDEVYKLVEIAKSFKQTKRAGVVSG